MSIQFHASAEFFTILTGIMPVIATTVGCLLAPHRSWENTPFHLMISCPKLRNNPIAILLKCDTRAARAVDDYGANATMAWFVIFNGLNGGGAHASAPHQVDKRKLSTAMSYQKPASNPLRVDHDIPSQRADAALSSLRSTCLLGSSF